MVDERTIKLKTEVTSAILKIQHLTGAIDFNKEYLDVINILHSSFENDVPIRNSEEVVVQEFISKKELYYSNLPK